VDKQQLQTKKYFERYGNQWSKSVSKKHNDFVNVIEIREQYVIDTCKKFLKKKSRVLDVGCGTGELVIKLQKMKYDSNGIDFSRPMINKAKRLAKKEKIDTEKFTAGSFFEFMPKKSFDLISANGFIEYVSEKELDTFLQKSFKFLSKKGILIFSSRNRLFNCFSLNKYTESEINLGEINNILSECILFNNSKNLKEVISKKHRSNIRKNLQKHELTKTKYAKIKVDMRFQYTPLQLVKKLRDNGFEIVGLFPVHIHAVSTGSKDKLPKIHSDLSQILFNQKSISTKLIPQCSSFMISARKK